VQVAPDGKQTKLFESNDLSVQVVRVGPDGAVYAATLPSGKVYRLQAGQASIDQSKAEVVFDPVKTDEKPKYIWDMAFDREGRLYIATGGPAAIYRLTLDKAGAKPEKFFSSDEPHLRCLLFEPDGSLIAGSDGDGLVYRIGKDGKGYVIYDAPKAEITALAESPEGTLFVAAVGEKNKNNLPPLPVQGSISATATITFVQPGSIQASNNNGLVPQGSDLYEIDREGAPRRLWEAHDEVVYALASTPLGLLVATGNRGHIYRVQPDGRFADLAHAEASQAIAFAPSPQGFYLGTSNSGKVLSLAEDAAAEHSYRSQVFDAGFFSRLGRPDVDAPGAAYDLFVRTGNIENPVRGWGDWQKVVPGTDLGSARFAQWKVVLRRGQVDAVGIHYLPVNVAPEVDEIVVVPGARANAQAMQQPGAQQVSINLPSAQNANNFVALNQEAASGPLPAVKDRAAVTVRWAAHDDNGDDLSFRVYFKAEEETEWLPLRDRTRERFYSFDAIRIPDGVYRLKVVASDAPSHAPGEAKTGEKISERFTLDTTPPVISGMTARTENGKVHVTLSASDALSTIERAEYSIDAGRWLCIDPAGRLSDSKQEHYDFIAAVPKDADEDDAESGPGDTAPSAKPAGHVITVRVYDRYGNATAEKALVREPK
jgi:WD40 repeat protein